MLNSVFSNHLFKHPSSRLIPLNFYKPLPVSYGQFHLSTLLERPISNEEYEFFQQSFHTLGSPDIAVYTKAWNKLVHKYYKKNQMDYYFYFLKNRTIHATYSLLYKDNITAVDRKNSFSHYALDLKFPNPKKLILAYPNHPEFDSLLKNNVSGLMYVKIQPIKHSKIHPFKIHTHSQYLYFNTEEPFLAVISKEEYQLYKHYMTIDPIWVLSSHTSVCHPAKKEILYWLDKKESAQGDEKIIIKQILVYLYSLGGKIKHKNCDIFNQKDMDNLKETMNCDYLPYFNKHFTLNGNTITYADVFDGHAMYMWNALIQAASTADILSRIWDIERRGGVIHYCNVDALHYTLKDPYTWDSSWKVEMYATEGIWLYPGVWRLKDNNGYWHEKQHAWSEHQHDCLKSHQKYPLFMEHEHIRKSFISNDYSPCDVQKNNEALLLHYFNKV